MSPRTLVQSRSSPVRVSLEFRDGPYWECQFEQTVKWMWTIDVIPSLMETAEHSVSHGHGSMIQKNQPARNVERIR